MMERQSTLEAAAWILPFTNIPPEKYRLPKEQRALLKHSIPAEFEAYGMLLPPIIYTGDAQPEDPRFEATVDAKLAAMPGMPHPEGKRLLWRALAELFEVPFSATIDNKTLFSHCRIERQPPSLWGIIDGYLDKTIKAALLPALQQATTSLACYFYFDMLTVEFQALLSDKSLEEGLLYMGDITDVMKIHEYADEIRENTPTFWWPENREWLVHTDYDYYMTDIGCSRALMQELLANPELELLEITPQHKG